MTTAAVREGAPPRRALHRATGGDRLVGGVAAGLAEHLGLSPLVVRVAFALLAAAGGMGIALYAGLWVFVPQQTGGTSAGPRDRTHLWAFAALGAGVVLALHQLDVVSGAGSLPVAAVVVGVALVWRQADEAQRARWRATASSGPRGVARVVVGSVLLVSGLTWLLVARGSLGAVREGLLPAAVVVVALVVLTAPFWLRLTSDLREERRERIRSEERAEVAAHVHDSVLQTLALIQKAAEDPREVTRLARSQERELRGWLYRPTTSVAFAAALEQAAAEVEEAHRTPVEVVVVGDCPADARVGALVAAAREAMVNAAKHAQAAQVRVFAEVEPDAVTVFVRDRGIGFDPAAVPADRFGIAESVVGRMTRNGGTAEVRSAPGEGTEVHLAVPRG